MFGYILGVVLFITVVIMGIGVVCYCMIAGRSDRIAEEMTLKEKLNIKNTL